MGNNSTSRPKDYKPALYADLITDEDSETTGLKPIRVILNESLTSSAVESIRDSQEIANALAKELIIDILSDKGTENKFGIFLQHIFTFDSTLQSARDLVFWGLKSDQSMSNATTLAKESLSAWSKGAGSSQLLVLSNNWLHSAHSKTTSITPLLLWTLNQKQAVHDPLTDIVSKSIPFTQVCLPLSALTN